MTQTHYESPAKAKKRRSIAMLRRDEVAAKIEADTLRRVCTYLRSHAAAAMTAEERRVADRLLTKLEDWLGVVGVNQGRPRAPQPMRRPSMTATRGLA